MEWIQSFLTDSNDQSSYSRLFEWIQLITLQSLILTAFLAGAKRYLNSICNTPDEEEALPFIKYPLAALEYIDSVEAYCISCIRNFLVECFRKLRSCLFTTLSNFNQSLNSPTKVHHLQRPACPIQESPRSRGERRVMDKIRRLVGEDAPREISLRSGTVSSTWKLTRSTVKTVAKKSDLDEDRYPLPTVENSNENPKPSLCNDWYGYWVRQRQQAQVPEVVERFGRPRTLLQGSNIPKTMRLLTNTKHSRESQEK